MDFYILKLGSVEKGESGEDCGSEYDLQCACKICGTGARLKGKLFVRGVTKVKDNLFQTLNGDFLISSNLYLDLKNSGLKLVDATGVVDTRGKPLPFYHLNPRHSFSKMLPESQGFKIDNQCQTCRQNGYFSDVIIGNLESNVRTFIKPVVAHYPYILDDLPKSDIFHTWEHIGYSNLEAQGNRVVRYARPLLIVSEKMKNELERVKIKKLSFFPLIIHYRSTEN